MGIKIEADWNAVGQDITGKKRDDELTDLQKLEKAGQWLKEVQSGGRMNTESQKSDLDDVIIQVDALIDGERSDQDVGGQQNQPAKRAESDIRNG